jgi:outer membrane immunogenic protein
MKTLLSMSTVAAVLAFGATAANAEGWPAGPANWTGFYVGGQAGYSWQPADGDEAVSFDRNLDGTYGDSFPNFSPGFCGGAPTSATPASGCRKDNDGALWKVHAGYDYQFSDTVDGIVVGGVLEGGKAYLADNVTAYSTTPAVYRIGARLKETAALRGRAGYSFSTGTLIYATGGGAYGKIRNSFSTSNGVNTFTTSGAKKDAWGYTYGGGIEQKVGPFSVGALYLFTSLKNDSYVVNASGGPAGGPFTSQSTLATGTNFQRGFSKFGYHQMVATVSYRF